MRKLILIIILLSLMTPSCTRVISEQSRRMVDTEANFMQVRENADKFIGKHIMLGGRIAGVKNSPAGTSIEIVQFDLTDSGEPVDSFISAGRFLATSSDFLDALIYRKGMLITLVGEIKGTTMQRIDEMEYLYPVIAMREWYLWPGSDWEKSGYYPSQPPMYDPYYYGYGFEPYWFRPYGPPYYRLR
ncbi:MAG TPA: Slp family lipoprotein [Geobacteraceae bacterium]|nr:Slp family lipoprotein [Geobacteraceae bacterium]